MEPPSREQMLAEILAIEKRLGTPEECPDDFDRVTSLVHELNNSLTVLQAKRILSAMRGGSNPPIAAEGVAAAI